MERIFKENQCTACGHCIDVCPKKIIRFSENVNEKGLHYVELIREEDCIQCRRCEIICPSGAVSYGHGREPEVMEWMGRDDLAPHYGCPLGVIARMMSQAILNTRMSERVAIFKSAKTEINTKFDQHCFTRVEEYVAQALKFKRENPDRIVILYYTDANQASHAFARELLRQLKDESITIIHSINGFRPKDGFEGLMPGITHIPEEAAKNNRGAFICRGSVLTPEEILTATRYIEKALRMQDAGEGYSLIEITYPCYYRIMDRPKEQVSYEQRKRIQKWFADWVEPEFKVGVLRNKTQKEKKEDGKS